MIVACLVFVMLQFVVSPAATVIPVAGSPADVVLSCRRQAQLPAAQPASAISLSRYLLDLGIEWKAVSEAQELFEGRDRATGAVRWTGTRADLVFGSHSQLRALAESFAEADALPRFVATFVQAWTKVMEADRFEGA